MGPGGIATIIAAVSLLVIAFALGYLIVRVGRLFTEIEQTIKSVNKIVHTTETFTEKMTDSITGLLEKNSALIKVVGTLATAFLGKKLSRSDREQE
jgi:uncharacterized protein YoxC